MKPAKKLLPSRLSRDVQRKLVLQPESNPTEHVPFEHASDHPFDAADPASRINAWWLAEASWLAYWRDADAVTRVLRERASLSCTVIAIDRAECYLAACPRFAIVTFRGTRSDDWSDIFDDACYTPIAWDLGHVHKGFARRLDVFRQGLEQALARLPSGCRVWFTGHSLGAAVATLAAYRYRASAGGVCTFGSPLVGNEVFTSGFTGEFATRSLRYANNRDIVTRVPPGPFAFPFGLFSHVDSIRWIDRDGRIGTAGPSAADLVRDLVVRTKMMLDLARLQRGESILPPALVDHTPLFYALHCWNDYAEHGKK